MAQGRPQNPIQFAFDTDYSVMVIDSTRLFVPPGDVWEWCEDRAIEIHLAAKAYAPPGRRSARRPRVSTGRLQNSIFYDVRPAGAKRIDIVVSANTEYALYVHEGTANQGNNYIYTTRGWAQKGVVDSWINNNQFRGSADDRGFWMPLPGYSILPTTKFEKARTPYPSIRYTLRVRGQRANPFLADAYSLVQGKHKGLPPMRAHKFGGLSRPGVFRTGP